MLNTLERPSAPTSVEETGLDPGLLTDLVLKTLYFAGNVRGDELSTQLALPLHVTSTLLNLLRREKLCAPTGGSSVSVAGLNYALTATGLERAASVLSMDGYVGPAPVPLADYFDVVRRQSVHDLEITREAIEGSLVNLVLKQSTLDRIGQAVSSKRAVLLYGGSGNGKSTVAEDLGRAFPGTILIPHAVEVMHQIIRVFDPSTHEPIEEDPATRGNSRMVDRRWNLIKRPLVFAAGELASSHLEVVLDPVHKTYEAPIQMKANGGLLVIDDFGRQQLDAAYLVNRWIVPLEKGVDNLSLPNGASFHSPFDVVPIFVTNMQPADLADEAFLRRFRYKVEIPPPDADLFIEILKRECAANETVYDEGAADYLVEEHFVKPGRQMRGCHPRDIVEAIVAADRYQGREPALTKHAIDDACEIYFV
jgi:predicted ATPase with chaperone activity